MNENIFLPGHNRVSSLKELTVSSDDSIVVALPSNILPENNNNNHRFDCHLKFKLQAGHLAGQTHFCASFHYLDPNLKRKVFAL